MPSIARRLPVPAGGIAAHGLSQVGQGSPVDDATPTRRRRGVRRGRLSRREFIQRGAVVGLSMASISAVIAACGGATPSASGAAAPSGVEPGASAPARLGQTGGTIRVRRPASRVGRSGRDAGPRRLRDHGPVVRIPVHAADDRRPGRPRPGPRRDMGAQRRRHRLDVQAPPGRQVAGRGSEFTSDDVVATMERLVAAGNSGLKGVLEPGGAVATDANTVTFTLARWQRQLPVPRLGLQRPDADHPGRLRQPARRSTSGPPGPAPGSSSTTTRRRGATFERNPDWWGGQTPLDGTELIFFDATGPMVTAYQGDQVDAIVQFDVLYRSLALRRPELHPDRHARRASPPDLDAYRQRPVRRQAGPPGAGLDVRPAGAHRPAVPGRAELGNDHVIWQGYPYFDALGPAAGPGHRQGEGAPRRSRTSRT